MSLNALGRVDLGFDPHNILSGFISLPATQYDTPGKVLAFWDQVKARLETLTVKIAVRAGDGGRLYGSVTPTEVVGAVRQAGGPELDRRRVELPSHIKSTGNYKVQVRLHPEVSATFTLTVNAAK